MLTTVLRVSSFPQAPSSMVPGSLRRLRLLAMSRLGAVWRTAEMPRALAMVALRTMLRG